MANVHPNFNEYDPLMGAIFDVFLVGFLTDGLQNSLPILMDRTNMTAEQGEWLGMVAGHMKQLSRECGSDDYPTYRSIRLKLTKE